MHLLVPFAGCLSDAGQQALQSLSLPHLERFLDRLPPAGGAGAQPQLGSDEYSLNPPHEQALALAWGWSDNAATLPDASLPFAARQAAALGLPGAHSAAWGLLTPVNLQAGREQIRLNNPQDLQLDEPASRELLGIVRPLFETEGFVLHWAGPLHWLATHPQFDALPCASLDRVIGRHLDLWLPNQPAARLVRRLQNEVQMMMYTHPVNDRREAAGLAPVNSFWLSGCGRLPAAAKPVAAPPAAAPSAATPSAATPSAAASAAAPSASAEVTVDDRLRDSALAEDWATWREAWQALDGGPIQALLHRSGGHPGAPPARLTLCGERRAQAFEALPTSLWQRLASAWRKPDLHAVLAQL